MNIPIMLFGIYLLVLFVTCMILIGEFALEEDELYIRVTKTIECNVQKGTTDRCVQLI